IFARNCDINRLRKTESECLYERGSQRESPRQSHSFAVGKIASATPRNDNKGTPVARNATDPVRGTITAPVRAGITAQYKTKISIINKEKNNNKDISFSSSFSKNKQTEKPRMNTDKHLPIGLCEPKARQSQTQPVVRLLRHTTPRNDNMLSRNPVNPIRKDSCGFKPISNNIWHVIENIRQRQIQNQK
ncbi:MAG: hypothetical protein KGZ86_05310, partial [Candidatus Latescibacteria bacterium]|nr:hypothetical protein [Candidatus Latescibacterota bacterium]